MSSKKQERGRITTERNIKTTVTRDKFTFETKGKADISMPNMTENVEKIAKNIKKKFS